MQHFKTTKLWLQSEMEWASKKPVKYVEYDIICMMKVDYNMLDRYWVLLMHRFLIKGDIEK